MLEIWKDIPNYEGLYQASNLGSIKSLREIERELNIAHNNLSLAIKNKDGIMNNYKWQFV